MVGKVFKIFCDSPEHLSSDFISAMLLKHVTLNPQEPDVTFGMLEVGNQQDIEQKNGCVLVRKESLQ